MRLPFFKDNPELKRRAYCLLGSFLIHTVFFVLLFLLFRRIEVIIYEKETTDVLITPREKLFLPEWEGDLPFPESGSLDLGLTGRILRKKPSLPRPEGEPAAPSGEERESIPESQGEILSGSAYSSGFRLGVPPDTVQDPLIAGELDLTLGQRKTAGIPDARPEGTRMKSGDLKKYAYSGIPGTGTGTSGYYPGAARRRTAQSRTSIIFDDKGFDLSPWAAGLVDQILRHWQVNPSSGTPEKAEVKVFVKAQKNGDLLAVEIITPSQAVSFDQAAINAIYLSSPFAKLPENFPEADIDITFVFSTQ